MLESLLLKQKATFVILKVKKLAMPQSGFLNHAHFERRSYWLLYK